MKLVVLGMKKFSLLILFCYSAICFSQSKNEKEERIDSSDFPEIAIRYFSDISNQIKNLRFFRESDGQKKSFEAKFKLKKLHYSIEFDTIGKLEDIEILIREKDIPKDVFKKMMAYYTLNFDKVRHIKIQKQYINVSQIIDQEFINSVIKNSSELNTHFEIIAEVTLKKERFLKEFTFKSTGIFEKSRPISSGSYEYAFY